MSHAKSLRLGLAVLLIAAVLFASGALLAQADPAPTAQEAPSASARINLTITPKRLTFARNARSASVYVYNQGNSPATVDVTLVDRVMLPNGDIRTFDDAVADVEAKPFADRLHSARGLIVATPRRITLAPGRGQTVRLRVTPPAGAEATEYRSHLTVATVPPREAGLTAEDAAAQRPGELTFRLNAVFGLSIPVIIRTETDDVRAEIRDLRLDEEVLSTDGVAPPARTTILAFDLARLGANSLFGNLEVRSAGGDDVIGLARGVGVYPEIDSRLVRIPLRRQPAAGEVLEVTFVDDDLTPGRVVAKASLIAS